MGIAALSTQLASSCQWKASTHLIPVIDLDLSAVLVAFALSLMGLTEQSGGTESSVFELTSNSVRCVQSL